MTWIIALVALAGTVLNICRKWQGFMFWLVSTSYWCLRNYNNGEYAQSFVFAIFFLLALYGIYEWRLKRCLKQGREK